MSSHPTSSVVDDHSDERSDMRLVPDRLGRKLVESLLWIQPADWEQLCLAMHAIDRESNFPSFSDFRSLAREARDAVIGSLEARKAERAAAGRRINPATAEVGRWAAPVVDPYHDLSFIPDFAECFGSSWYAWDPVERIAVLVEELPDEVKHAIENCGRQGRVKGGATHAD